MTDKAVFLSCARVDTGRADRLVQALERAGIPAARGDEVPGDVPAFLACFSADGLFRDRPYCYEQFSRAAGEVIPVRFDECEVPPWSLPDGRLLNGVPASDVFDGSFDDGAAGVAAALRKLLGAGAVAPAVPGVPSDVPPGVPETVGPAVSAPGPGDEGLAERARNVRLSTTRFRPGYDQGEVDSFLELIADHAARLAGDIRSLEAAEAEAARSGRDISAAAAALTWPATLTPGQIRDKRISTTRLRPGYDEHEVDAFLDAAEAALARLLAAREDLRSRLSR